MKVCESDFENLLRIFGLTPKYLEEGMIEIASDNRRYSSQKNVIDYLKTNYNASEILKNGYNNLDEARINAIDHNDIDQARAISTYQAFIR